jgi:polysaccharide export outer membrane protein
MRPTALFVVVMLAAVAGGCAGTAGQRLGAAPRQATPSAQAQATLPQISPTKADLDSLAYGSPASANAGYGNQASRNQPYGNAAHGNTASGARPQTVAPTPAVAQAPLPPPTSAPPVTRAQVAAPAPTPAAATAAAPAPAPETAHAHAVPAAVPVVVPAEAFAGEPPYLLDTGDRLRIVVFGQDGLSNSYAVDASGAITMPLIKAVQARGLTTQQLARAITEKLRGGFVREPHVAIEVEVYRPFFILGEVTTPGQYAYVPHMTVESAVAVAGGFTPRAYRWDIQIDRPYAGGIMRSKVPLITRVRPGDTIVVKERWF